MRVSRGFVCALAGVGMTLLAWFGPWAWPAWPAFAALDLVFGTGGSYHELPPAGRGAVIVMLIVINVTTWAVTGYTLWIVARRFTQGSEKSQALRAKS